MGSWVLVFDEFDMLGRERSDRADHGELRRVVAAMLQVVDDHPGDSLFVATSNHPALLGSAAWRRFDEIIEIEAPDHSARFEILELKLRSVRHDFDIFEAATKMGDFSAAEVEAAAELPEVQAPDARSAIVGLVDSGVASGHPLIGAAVLASDAIGTGIDEDQDQHGHGTMVASLLLHGNVADAIAPGLPLRP